MDVSKRIDFIVDNLDKVECLADIGTDHGYVPLLALEREKANKVIACDINKDPLDKAKLNAILEGIVGNEIDFRLGSGLKPLEMKEANSVVIAGMGGNLIRDILEADMEKVNSLESLILGIKKLIQLPCLILVPAQNPEVLREYLYENNYEIIKEDLCFDEGVYYELFKVRRAEGHATELDSIYYEISPMLLRQKHPLMREYLESKIKNYSKILGFISEDSESAILRKKEVEEKISIINSMMNYL